MLIQYFNLKSYSVCVLGEGFFVAKRHEGLMVKISKGVQASLRPLSLKTLVIVTRNYSDEYPLDSIPW